MEGVEGFASVENHTVIFSYKTTKDEMENLIPNMYFQK